jgi:hypothetical protein
LLPAGAIAGWGLHPLESAAFSRRTPKADIHAIIGSASKAGAALRLPIQIDNFVASYVIKTNRLLSHGFNGRLIVRPWALDSIVPHARLI